METARAIQAARFADVHTANILVNYDMGLAEVQRFCLVDEAGKNLMQAAMQRMNLSDRAYHRVLKLSRTIADLSGETQIQVPHLTEAL